MKFISIVLAYTLLAFGVAQTSSAQAFGIQMGQNPAELAGAILIENQTQGELKAYQMKTAPQPHSEFESYTIWATDDLGVCKVVGIGKDHSPDKSGYGIRNAYSELKGALTSKYGQGKEFDFLHGGSIWNEMDEFAMSLKQGERTLASYFDRDEQNELPDEIVAISLQAHATGSRTTFLMLQYEFENFEACKAAQLKLDNNGL